MPTSRQTDDTSIPPLIPAAVRQKAIYDERMDVEESSSSAFNFTIPIETAATNWRRRRVFAGTQSHPRNFVFDAEI